MEGGQKEEDFQELLDIKREQQHLEKIITHAAKIGVKYLTVYAFSTENWKRSQEEVSALMFLFKSYIKMKKKI